MWRRCTRAPATIWKCGIKHFLFLHKVTCKSAPYRYGAFVAALEEGSRDNLEWVKERALKAAAELLRAKPEGEAQLLSLLVNKLGDPSRKVASKVQRMYCCGQLPLTQLRPSARLRHAPCRCCSTSGATPPTSFPPRCARDCCACATPGATPALLFILQLLPLHIQHSPPLLTGTGIISHSDISSGCPSCLRNCTAKKSCRCRVGEEKLVVGNL